MIQIIELNIEAEDASDYESKAEEILTAFCDELESRGETRPIEKIDENWWAIENGMQYFWSSKASDMIRAKVDELYAIGRKYFGEDASLEISTHLFVEE